MKRKTRKELVQDERRANEEASILRNALNDVINGEVMAKATSTSSEADEGQYTFRLLRPCSPCGGILMVTYHYPGQRDTTSVYRAEEAFREVTHGVPSTVSHYPQHAWKAIDEIRVVYNKANAPKGDAHGTLE